MLLFLNLIDLSIFKSEVLRSNKTKLFSPNKNNFELTKDM